jgi:hypothetical protein
MGGRKGKACSGLGQIHLYIHTYILGVKLDENIF